MEETPGRLEYEVALYKEAPAAKIHNISGNNNELPVDQAVPIGMFLLSYSVVLVCPVNS